MVHRWSMNSSELGALIVETLLHATGRDHVRSAHPAPGAVCRGQSAKFWGQDSSAGGSVPLLLRECLEPSEPADSCHGYVCETRVSLADASYGVEDNKQAGDCRNDAAASHQTHSTFGVEPAVAHLTDDVALVCPNSRARVGPRPLMMENCRISMLRSLRTFMA